MGSKEKAREFMKASEVINHYSSIFESLFSMIIQKVEEKNSDIANQLKKVKGDFEKDFAAGAALLEDAYGDLFTEDELEELIVIYTNPVLKRFRSSTREIIAKVGEKRK